MNLGCSTIRRPLDHHSTDFCKEQYCVAFDRIELPFGNRTEYKVAVKLGRTAPLRFAVREGIMEVPWWLEFRGSY